MTGVPPILLALQLCERVIVDRLTGMGSVISILEVLNATSFPVRHPNMTIFCELTNGHGQEVLTAKLVDVQNDEAIVFEQNLPVLFEDARQIVRCISSLRGLVFAHEGEYRVQLWADEHLLNERRIILRKINMEGKKHEKG